MKDWYFCLLGYFPDLCWLQKKKRIKSKHRKSKTKPLKNSTKDLRFLTLYIRIQKIMEIEKEQMWGFGGSKSSDVWEDEKGENMGS